MSVAAPALPPAARPPAQPAPETDPGRDQRRDQDQDGVKHDAEQVVKRVQDRPGNGEADGGLQEVAEEHLAPGPGAERSRQEITAGKRDLFDRTLTGGTRRHLADRIRHANDLVDRMNARLERVRTASTMAIRLVWQVSPDLPAGTKAARDLLLKDPVRMGDDDQGDTAPLLPRAHRASQGGQHRAGNGSLTRSSTTHRGIGPRSRSTAATARVGIRTWAKEHGIAASERGRIPISVLEQYQAAAKRR